MAIYTASFYEPHNWRGKLFRVSRRPPRGVKKVWEDLPWAYPSKQIYRQYRNEEIGATVYFQAYVSEITGKLHWLHGDRKARIWLFELPTDKDITLLCHEKGDKELCHRHVLAHLLNLHRRQLRLSKQEKERGLPELEE